MILLIWENQCNATQWDGDDLRRDEFEKKINVGLETRKEKMFDVPLSAVDSLALKEYYRLLYHSTPHSFQLPKLELDYLNSEVSRNLSKGLKLLHLERQSSFWAARCHALLWLKEKIIQSLASYVATHSSFFIPY